MAKQVKTVKTQTVSVKTLKGVPDQLKALADIHADRAESYGMDYLRIGPSLLGMFPEGIELKSEQDLTRFVLFCQAHGKLLRYAARFKEGGHTDSLDDLSLYSQILRYVD